MKNFVLVLIGGAFLLGSATLAQSQDLAPTDKKMLMLSIGGPRFGAAEISFTAHNMSIKNSLGNSIWSDKEPDWLKVMNLENGFYMKQSVLDYASDRGNLQGRRGTRLLETKEIKLIDGHNGKETVAAVASHKGRRFAEQKTQSITGVKLPASMITAWNTIMASPDEKDLVVGLTSTKGRYEDGTARSIGTMRPLVEFRSLKLVPLQPDRFAIPKNYKEAKDAGSFYFSPDGKELKKSDIDDLFRSSK